MTSTYSTVGDILLGDLPIPGYVDKQKYVDDAAEEMDSYIGYTYVTPIDMDTAGPVIRPARLLLHRIATHLSTGRLILALAVASEDKSLHAYGKSLVDESLAAVQKIVDREIPITGAISVSGSVVSPSGPMITNVDSFSLVEDFYQWLSNPPSETESTWRTSGG